VIKEAHWMVIFIAQIICKVKRMLSNQIPRDISEWFSASVVLILSGTPTVQSEAYHVSDVNVMLGLQGEARFKSWVLNSPPVLLLQV